MLLFGVYKMYLSSIFILPVFKSFLEMVWKQLLYYENSIAASYRESGLLLSFWDEVVR
jgi:hypothetical protein